MPALFSLGLQHLVATFPSQTPQIVKAAGLNLALTQAKQGLGPLTPEPAGGNRQTIAPGTHQLDPLGQGLGQGVSMEQEPGRTEIAPGGERLRQGCVIDAPGGLAEPLGNG
jgi:hypothetical protein